MTIERLTTGDFIGGLLVRSGDGRVRGWLSLAARLRARADVWAGRGQAGWRGHVRRCAGAWLAYGPFED